MTLIDIREPDEVGRTGAIPGAIQAPRGMLEFWADPASPYHCTEFDPASRTLLYCASGGRSALAIQSRRTLGYTDVAHLDGGLIGLGGARPPRHPSRTELSHPTTAAATRADPPKWSATPPLA